MRLDDWFLTPGERGNGATAVPVMFVPLAIFWGWSWIANAYSGRSVVPMAAYTLALFVGVSLIGPADAYFFPQGSAAFGVNDFVGGLLQGPLFERRDRLRRRRDGGQVGRC